MLERQGQRSSHGTGENKAPTLAGIGGPSHRMSSSFGVRQSVNIPRKERDLLMKWRRRQGQTSACGRVGYSQVTGESSTAEIHCMPVFPVKQSFQNIKGKDRVKIN